MECDHLLTSFRKLFGPYPCLGIWSRVQKMKHGTRFWQKKLSRTPEHRQALLKNLITSLVVNEKIQTTVAKAKFMARSVNLVRF